MPSLEAPQQEFVGPFPVWTSVPFMPVAKSIPASTNLPRDTIELQVLIPKSRSPDGLKNRSEGSRVQLRHNASVSATLILERLEHCELDEGHTEVNHFKSGQKQMIFSDIRAQM